MDETTQSAGQELTATNLKNALWETLQGVRSGEIQPGTADAIAVQAREIVRTVRVQIQIAGHTKRNLSTDVIGFAER